MSLYKISCYCDEEFVLAILKILTLTMVTLYILINSNISRKYKMKNFRIINRLTNIGGIVIFSTLEWYLNQLILTYNHNTNAF